MKLMHKTLVVAAITVFAGVAQAAVVTGPIMTTFTITATCDVSQDGATAVSYNSVTGGTFDTKTFAMGTVAQSAALLNASAYYGAAPTTTYGVNCGAATSYVLSFNDGANAVTGAGTSTLVRRLRRSTGSSAGDYVEYNLFKGVDAGATDKLFGATGSGTYSGTGDGTTVTAGAVVAKIVDGSSTRSKNAGTFTDTVTVTLSITP